jgi:hypothetical protein
MNLYSKSETLGTVIQRSKIHREVLGYDEPYEFGFKIWNFVER